MFGPNSGWHFGKSNEERCPLYVREHLQGTSAEDLQAACSTEFVRWSSVAMKKALPFVAVVLALGYLIPLSKIPWIDHATRAFEQQAWLVVLAMFCLNVVGSVLFFRFKGSQWTVFAILFCGLQVFGWWWFSGVRSVEGGLTLLLEHKIRATRALLEHGDFRIVFATLHQDIAMGLFYHFAFAWLLIETGIRKLAVSRH